MQTSKKQFSTIPTNIITGFLGVGKTSTILNLLKSKPKDERWAVLVNEFGEIGIDVLYFKGFNLMKQGVFISEVPGGCMCCAAGLSMQIALNQLIAKANPHRILIEPTGLGHPKEVLQTLMEEHYQEVLSIEQIITLVDSRKLASEKYTTHETFNQQIALADLVVGNKVDLYEQNDQERLLEYVEKIGQRHSKLCFTSNGKLDLSQINGKTHVQLSISNIHESEHSHDHAPRKSIQLFSDKEIPECGYLRAKNEGEGYQSIGWRFSPNKTFDYKKLFNLLNGIRAERMKAVFITELGIFGYNLTSDSLTEIELDDCFESRIEIISEVVDDKLEQGLIACFSD